LKADESRQASGVMSRVDLMSLLFRLQASFFLVKDDFDRFSWSIPDSQDGVYFDRPNGNLLVSS
jgi:hypothetical protein